MRNPPFYSFALCLIFSLTPSINKPDFFKMSLISSLEVINVFIPDANMLLWLVASAADAAAAANPNGIKTLFDNGLSTFFIKGNTVFSNGLQSLKTCVFVNNNFYKKLFSSSEDNIICNLFFVLHLQMIK